MKIAYTVCSANYLPFAKAIADSLVHHNPEYQFVIALADTYRGYDPAFFAPHQIIPVQEMQIPELGAMNSKYTIFELSCALKPFVAEFLFQTNPSCDTVFYFDSDILVYGPLSVAEYNLQNRSILLTPHLSLLPSDDQSIAAELDVLRTGLYNAGFFGIRRTQTSTRFLDWWKRRLRDYCFNDASHGLFVDQLWLDLVPLYFCETIVLYDEGYNLAYWNFNERHLDIKDGNIIVNKIHPLTFFHFSGYDIESPDIISKYQKIHSFESLPQYKPFFEEYVGVVMKNNTSHFRSLTPTMGTTPVATTAPVAEPKTIRQKLKKLFLGSGI